MAHTARVELAASHSGQGGLAAAVLAAVLAAVIAMAAQRCERTIASNLERSPSSFHAFHLAFATVSHIDGRG